MLVVLTGQWWMLAVGALCIAGAWFYTGGDRPYGYSGWGEAAVFLFFGLVAVLGTQYVQAGRVSWIAVGAAVAMGAFSASVLVANNLRDVPTDSTAGKVTLAVRLGESRTRTFYLALAAVPLAISVLGAVQTPLLLIGLLAAVPLLPAVRRVAGGQVGPALIPVLRDTGLAMLLWAVLTAAALTLA